MPTRRLALLLLLPLAVMPVPHVEATYTNFESSHVHPIAVAGDRLLVVNTPDARLEVFDIEVDGSLTHATSVQVGLEPVTVVPRTPTEAWVVNNLSDTISVVDLAAGGGSGVVIRTLKTGDEPTDVAFNATHAFVAVSQEDAVKRFDLGNLDAVPDVIPLFARDIRALAMSATGSELYAVSFRSGNKTTIVNANLIFGNSANLDATRLAALGLSDITCSSPPPGYPPLPPGITRNPALTDPPPGTPPEVGLIVGWNDGAGQWQDETGANWSDCLPFRLPDYDLFEVDTSSLAVNEVAGLGTLLFDVSVQPGSGKVWVANTDARNLVRFEHPSGLGGHLVDNRLSVYDTSPPNNVDIVDLNGHINRASDPATNVAERNASISQPGMMAWKSDGSFGYLTGIGSRKLFRVDGGCSAASCIFGPDRAAPVAVEVGEGPTGVALHEARDRAYVVNRIDHSIAVVEMSTMTKLEDVSLHDPSSSATRDGRRFLYDAIDVSGHGDASCATCHPFGDLDGLAWDLGDPSGEMVPYSTSLDNVRFIFPLNGAPVECDPAVCAAHDGFDPQKGPMTTQTLRGMLEPLHWRGDRATMNDFNPAFVGLLGGNDIGPVNGKSAGLSATDMEAFRQFALAIRFPPNPFREVDDTMPCGPRASDPACEVKPPGLLLPGNPTEGALLFDNHASDAGQPCVACHTHPFGAGGGELGGVAPADPTPSTAAALFNGDADQNGHNDLKVAHLRNMYDKPGPVYGSGGSTPDTKSGFGLTHDGGVPDMQRFLSINVFSVDAQQVRDLSAFMFHFPTSIKPSVGQQLTLPQGAPPSGTVDEEALLTTLIGLGDASDGNRHCELVASAYSGGRQRTYHWSAGAWLTDAAADAPVSMVDLRQQASAPITFTCTPKGSGPRLGGDRDQDAVLDGDDCAADDPGSFGQPGAIADVVISRTPSTTLSWTSQTSSAGSGTLYDVLTADLSALRSTGIAAFDCLQGAVADAVFVDSRVDPAVGNGYAYLVRARNGCGIAAFGTGRETLDTLVCMP